MKSKLNFFGVCALTCALVLSLFSCTKDLQDQIDKLTTDVAALQSAINSGKLVKSVNPVAGGYDIVFSDNSTIRINHGTNGTNGTPGTPGTPGAAGFTPIIGIDADGYWTVVASQGATPVRIKNASGDEVKASMSDNLTLVDNYLAVNGTKTTIYIPNIAYNAVTRTLMIWAKNEDGTSTMYNVPLADEIVLTTDIVGLVSPIGITKVLLQYGAVPTTGGSATGNSWAGVTAGQLLGSNAVLPVIVNPSAAAISGYTFELVKADGSLYAFQGTIAQGFDITRKFEQYVSPPAGGSNALYTITLNPTLAAINTHLGTSLFKETKELAVRATKGGREISSAFQYSVMVKKADVQLLTADPATPDQYWIPTGKSIDVMSLYSSVAPYDVTKMQSATNFYKVGVSYPTAPATSEDIKPYITIDPATSIITTATGHHSVANLNGRQAFYTLKTFDYTGAYIARAVTFNYFTDLTASIPNVAAITHTLQIDKPTTATIDEREVKVNLDDMFVALDAAGKTALWRAHAMNMDLSVKIEGVTYTGSANIFAETGISYRFIDVNGATTINASDVRKIVFLVDPTVAFPESYTFKFVFQDNRIGAPIPNTPANVKAFGTFTFDIPLTVINPSALPSNAAALTVHTVGLWTGNELSVFGPSTGQTVNPVRYDLTGAYSAALGTAFAANEIEFRPSVAADRTANLVIAKQSYLVQRQTGTGAYTTLYTPKSVVLRYFWFGNPDNYVDLETISVVAKSEIKEGKIVNLINAKSDPALAANDIHKGISVVHGVAGTVALSTAHRFNDYFGTDMTVFGVPNLKVAEVKLSVAPEYDNLLIIDQVNKTVESKISPLAPITGDVVVPVKVSVKDVFGLWFEGTVNVTVKKP